jgi:hypothetical protein
LENTVDHNKILGTSWSSVQGLLNPAIHQGCYVRVYAGSYRVSQEVVLDLDFHRDVDKSTSVETL